MQILDIRSHSKFGEVSHSFRKNYSSLSIGIKVKVRIKSDKKNAFDRGYENYRLFDVSKEGKYRRLPPLKKHDGYYETVFTSKWECGSVEWYPNFSINRKEFPNKNILPLSDSEIDQNQLDDAIFVIACQHPGETMAKYFLEGLLGELAQSEIQVVYADELLSFSQKNGHRLRAGVDYNRNWFVNSNVDLIDQYIEFIKANKLSMVIDIHGDEITKGFSYIVPSNKNMLNRVSGWASTSDRMILFEKSWWKKFLKKILNNSKKQKHLMRYCKSVGVNSMLIEISAHKHCPVVAKEMGKDLGALLLRGQHIL